MRLPTPLKKEGVGKIPPFQEWGKTFWREGENFHTKDFRPRKEICPNTPSLSSVGGRKKVLTPKRISPPTPFFKPSLKREWGNQ